MFTSRTTQLALALTGFIGLAATAHAETQWDRDHGRRDQVDNRLDHQHERIAQERREHEMTARRAHELHRDDHRFRGDERHMAAHDGGHVTPGEQHALDRHENGVGREIGR